MYVLSPSLNQGYVGNHTNIRKGSLAEYKMGGSNLMTHLGYTRL